MKHPQYAKASEISIAIFFLTMITAAMIATMRPPHYGDYLLSGDYLPLGLCLAFAGVAFIGFLIFGVLYAVASKRIS